MFSSPKTAPNAGSRPDLVGRGLARVSSRVGERVCARLLLAKEQAARAARLGLWGEPVYVMGKAEDPAEVLKQRGRFALVEGKVLSVRESGGTIYVNFGRRWSEDFTVTIAKRNERAFAAAGLTPKSLNGRRVRIRGWIEERGGPWVEAARPEQIEVLGNEWAEVVNGDLANGLIAARRLIAPALLLLLSLLLAAARTSAASASTQASLPEPAEADRSRSRRCASTIASSRLTAAPTRTRGSKR